MEVQSTQSFCFDDQGYHLTCQLTQKQLTITCQNLQDQKLSYYFGEIFTSEKFNSKISLVTLYQNFSQLYKVLQEKAHNKQLILKEGSIQMIGQIGSKRKRIPIELQKAQYTIIQTTKKNQCNKLQNQLSDIQKKMKNIQTQLQFYRSKQRINEHNASEGSSNYQEMMLVQTKKYENISNKAALLQKQFAELKQKYENSQQQNQQLRRKLFQMDERIFLIKKDCQKKLQNVDILNQNICVLEEQIKKQKEKSIQANEKYQLKNSQFLALTNDFRKVQNNLKTKQRQRKRLAEIIKKEENQKKIKEYQKKNKIVYAQQSHPNFKYFIIRDRIITLNKAQSTSFKEFVHIGIPNRISQNFQKISFKILKSKYAKAQMIFGISTKILSADNSRYALISQEFIGYNTDYSMKNLYSFNNGTYFNENSIKVGDIVTLQVNLITNRVQWYKNNLELLYMKQIPIQHALKPFYPTIILSHNGDSVQMIY